MNDQNPLTQQLINLLKTTLDDVVLNQALETLELENPGTLRELAVIWAPELVERNTTHFIKLFETYLHDKNHRDLIIQLLKRIDPRVDPATCSVLYKRVADIEQFNIDALALAQSKLNDQTVLCFLDAFGLNRKTHHVYAQHYMQLYDETAVAFYSRNPALFEGFIGACLSNKHDYSRLRELTYPSRAESDLYWRLFRMTATRDEWQRELLQLVDDRPAANIEQELAKRHPNADYEPDASVFQQLIETFGESLLPYLGRFSAYFGQAMIKTALETIHDDDELLRLMNQYRYQYHKGFAKSVMLWAPALLKRNPTRFEKFVKHNIPRKNHDAIRSLLPLIRQSNLLNLYREFYRQIVDVEQWNEEIVTLAEQYDLPGELLSELDWLDIDGEVHLYDDTATLLYQHSPEVLGDFIRRHLANINYVRLGKVAADSDFWWEVFRATATESMWQTEMQALLAADIPSENIITELEKRHLTHYTSKPRILKAFVDKYGEAVLPYLERHIRVLTPKRLRSLLALDINRGDLRRELETLARKYPSDFANMVDIWLPALYASDSDFFDKFILRNLNWSVFREHRPMLQRMLPQLEADGKNRLFTTIYRNCMDNPTWAADLRRLAASSQPDSEVLEALKRRNLRWELPNDVVLQLYKRNPDVFGDYIKDNVRRRWNLQNEYSQLIALARQRNDLEFARSLERYVSPESSWQQGLQQLVDNPVLGAEEVIQHLQAIKPTYTYQLDTKSHLVVKLLERYGEPLLDYVTDSARWIIGRNAKTKTGVLEIAEQHCSEHRYWKIFFRVANSKQWNRALRELLERNLPADRLWYELEKRMPPPPRNPRWGSHWVLDSDLALELHAIDPQRAYRLLTIHTRTFSHELFLQAENMNDDDLLDYMTYRQLIGWQHDPDIVSLATARLHQLYGKSPDRYVRHAATIMGHIRAFQIYGAKRLLQNPIFITLTSDEHRNAWLQSPTAIRDLLESPNIYAQIMALDILSQGGEQAAHHVIENLFLLRAFLLSRARINSKNKALNCLLHTADSSVAYARAVLPVVEDAIDYEGKRSIKEKAIVVYGRIQHITQSHQSLPESV